MDHSTRFYKKQISHYQEQYAIQKKRYQILGTLRLAVFIAAIVVTYSFWGSVILWSLVVFSILFLVLVSKSSDVKYLRDKAKRLIEINEQELRVLDGNWTDFEDGSEFRDAKHPFSNDMDLFGVKSFYQLINRTVTKQGSELLAGQLKNGTKNRTLTNDAISRLAENMEWSEEFLAEVLVYDPEQMNVKLSGIAKNEAEIGGFWKYILYVVPFFSILTAVAYYNDWITYVLFSAYISFLFLLTGKKLKMTNAMALNVISYTGKVKVIRRQMELLEKLDVKPGAFSAYKDEISGKGDSFKSALLKLEKIQKQMAYRMNWPVGLLLNYLFLYDYILLLKWQKWMSENAGHLAGWEHKLAQLEVWISGAFYLTDFPELTYAKLDKAYSGISILEMGHPFVNREKRVTNNVVLTGEQQFMIITGPNMAGKSTYLRSLGLVFICANAGFPVMAASCVIPELNLYTSMRTSDDLTVESSYFHAELSRLRFIVDAIERGEQVFVILDEILKGTNSADKELGSVRFLQKLVSLHVHGVIATHDLSLCKLAEESPRFVNQYFDSSIEHDELHFDYHIRPGVCKNMNASFLLKKMGLTE